MATNLGARLGQRANPHAVESRDIAFAALSFAIKAVS